MTLFWLGLFAIGTGAQGRWARCSAWEAASFWCLR